MSINNLEVLQDKKIDKVLERTSISDEIISNINNILMLENRDNIINKLLIIKENGKKIYQKYGLTIENKQKILEKIFNNISRFLNELNVDRVYNNTSYLLDDNISKNGDLEKMKNFLTIKGVSLSENNIVGASCNEWVVWLYNFVLEIVGNDNDINYTFQVNSNDAHGILYIDIGSNRYSFDSVTSGFKFDKLSIGENKAKRKNKPVFYDNQDDYFDGFINKMDQKDIIVYDNLGKKLKIVKKGIFLSIIYKNKPINFINIYGLKRLTKNLSKIGSLKYIGIVPKVYNLDNIKEFIVSKVNPKDKEDIKLILNQINDNKLLYFFNLLDK